MKKTARMMLVGGFIGAFAAWAPAQDYPTHKYTNKPKTTATPGSSDKPSATTMPDKPTGPLKMIKTEGERPGNTSNKDSPIKILELNYYDAGFGAKFNTEVRTSVKIENASRTDDVKKVTMTLEIVNGDGQSLTEWKKSIGTLKSGQPYTFEAPVWYNSLGIPLHSKVVIEHEEIPKKKK